MAVKWQSLDVFKAMKTSERLWLSFLWWFSLQMASVLHVVFLIGLSCALWTAVSLSSSSFTPTVSASTVTEILMFQAFISHTFDDLGWQKIKTQHFAGWSPQTCAYPCTFSFHSTFNEHAWTQNSELLQQWPLLSLRTVPVVVQTIKSITFIHPEYFCKIVIFWDTEF